MSFLVSEAVLTGPAFSELPDGAARLLLRASSYCSTHGLSVVTTTALRVMLATRRQAEELVSAGFWLETETGWESLLSSGEPDETLEPRSELRSVRAQAGRLGGQKSALARAGLYGTAQPRSKLEANGFASEDDPEANHRSKPNQTDEATPKQNAEAKTGVGSPSHTLPLLSLSGSSSFPALSEPFSSLQLSSEGPDPLPARGRKKPKSARWRRVPNDWEPTAEHLQLAVSLNVDLQLEQAKFRDHEFEKSKSDPDATFRNWLRNAKPSQRPLGAQTTERKYASSDDIDSMLGLS
jgi:hypothetical protein